MSALTARGMGCGYCAQSPGRRARRSGVRDQDADRLATTSCAAGRGRAAPLRAGRCGLRRGHRLPPGVERHGADLRGGRDFSGGGTDLVSATCQRWRIERDYQDLKQDFGLGHYEGRGWRGFHHHASLSIAAYGFLMAERAPKAAALRRPPPEREEKHLGLSPDTDSPEDCRCLAKANGLWPLAARRLFLMRLVADKPVGGKKKLHRMPSACRSQGLPPPGQPCARSDTRSARSRHCVTA